MAVTKHIFGKTPEGQEIEIYSITNKNGVCAEVMTYGATLVNLLVPGKDGTKADINLGYDCMEPYTVNTDNFLPVRLCLASSSPHCLQSAPTRQIGGWK